MNPSEVMLRSETNWTRSWFPLVTITLWRRRETSEQRSGPVLSEATRIAAIVPWCPVAAELPDPPGVIGLAAVEQRHVVVPAVGVGLQVQLLELHLDHLGNDQQKKPTTENSRRTSAAGFSQTGAPTQNSIHRRSFSPSLALTSSALPAPTISWPVWPRLHGLKEVFHLTFRHTNTAAPWSWRATLPPDRYFHTGV